MNLSNLCFDQQLPQVNHGYQLKILRLEWYNHELERWLKQPTE